MFGPILYIIHTKSVLKINMSGVLIAIAVVDVLFFVQAERQLLAKNVLKSVRQWLHSYMLTPNTN